MAVFVNSLCLLHTHADTTHVSSNFGLDKRFSKLLQTTNNVSILTTNQKAAGSSPAERAPEDPVNTAFLSLRYGFRTGPYSPFDHLSLIRNGFLGIRTAAWKCGFGGRRNHLGRPSDRCQPER